TLAALRISLALRSSAFSFCSRLISAAASVVSPGFTPAPTLARRCHSRSVSGLIPNSPATWRTALIIVGCDGRVSASIRNARSRISGEYSLFIEFHPCLKNGTKVRPIQSPSDGTCAAVRGPSIVERPDDMEKAQWYLGQIGHPFASSCRRDTWETGDMPEHPEPRLADFLRSARGRLTPERAGISDAAGRRPGGGAAAGGARDAGRRERRLLHPPGTGAQQERITRGP